MFRQKPVHLERNSLQFLLYIVKKCVNVTVEGEEELLLELQGKEPEMTQGTNRLDLIDKEKLANARISKLEARWRSYLLSRLLWFYRCWLKTSG